MSIDAVWGRRVAGMQMLVVRAMGQPHTCGAHGVVCSCLKCVSHGELWGGPGKGGGMWGSHSMWN